MFEMEDKKTQIENEVQATEEAKVVEETKVEEVVEETMDDYKDMIDSSMMQFGSGDIVEGEIISVTDTEVLINFGYISDGIVPASETFADAATPLTSQFNVGDKVKAEVVRKDDGEGNVLLSLKKALQEVVWDNLKEAMEKGIKNAQSHRMMCILKM
jgi:small subunit ribosomal protein S1